MKISPQSELCVLCLFVYTSTFMCFSAPASFSAGAVLSVIGVATIRRARRRSELLFASIPFLFAVQQVVEGVLWLSLTDQKYPSFNAIWINTFLAIAEVIWPVMVPLAILLMEHRESRRNMLRVLTGLGMVVSVFYIWCLSQYAVNAQASSGHIAYIQDFPDTLHWYMDGIYILATVAPHFVSTRPRMWFFGAAIVVSYIIAHQIYVDYIVSVWCFFASVISVVVYYVLKFKDQTNNREFHMQDVHSEPIVL